MPLDAVWGDTSEEPPEKLVKDVFRKGTDDPRVFDKYLVHCVGEANTVNASSAWCRKPECGPEKPEDYQDKGVKS